MSKWISYKNEGNEETETIEGLYWAELGFTVYGICDYGF